MLERRHTPTTHMRSQREGHHAPTDMACCTHGSLVACWSICALFSVRSDAPHEAPATPDLQPLPERGHVHVPFVPRDCVDSPACQTHRGYRCGKSHRLYYTLFARTKRYP